MTPFCSHRDLGKEGGVPRWQLKVQVQRSDTGLGRGHWPPTLIAERTSFSVHKATDLSGCQDRLSACGVATAKKGECGMWNEGPSKVSRPNPQTCDYATLHGKGTLQM